jgi:hypothetical protein
MAWIADRYYRTKAAGPQKWPAGAVRLAVTESPSHRVSPRLTIRSSPIVRGQGSQRTMDDEVNDEVNEKAAARRLPEVGDGC